MRNALTILAIAVALAGCANRTIVLETRLDEAAAAAQLQPGANTISGSAFVRQRNGGLVTCAGRAVSLMPASPMAREWSETMTGDPRGGFVDLSGRGYAFPKNQELFKHTRATVCDVDGKFAFDRVRDGEWLVFSRIVWSVPFGETGGLTIRTITVDGAKEHRVVLAP
jgi:hypothetical protein